MVLKRQLPSRLTKTKPTSSARKTRKPKQEVEASATIAEEAPVEAAAPAEPTTPAADTASAYGADDEDDLSAWLPENGSSEAKEQAAAAKEDSPAEPAPQPEPVEEVKAEEPAADSVTTDAPETEEEGFTPPQAEGLTAADFPEPVPMDSAASEDSAPLMGDDDGTMPYFPGDDITDEPKQVDVPPSWENESAAAAPEAEAQAPTEPEPVAAAAEAPAVEPVAEESAEDDWDVDELVQDDLPTPAAEEASAEPAAPEGLAAAKAPSGQSAPPPDFYADPVPEASMKAPMAPAPEAEAPMASEEKPRAGFKMPKMEGIPGLPPQLGGRKGDTPPELPEMQPYGGDKDGSPAARNALLLGVLVLLLGGGYYTVQNLTSVQEGLARATGTLSEFSEQIPAEAGGVAVSDVMAPVEVVIVGADKPAAPVAEPAPKVQVVKVENKAAEPAELPQPPAQPADTTNEFDAMAAAEKQEQSAPQVVEIVEAEPATKVEFVDVEPKQTDEPVVAEAEAELPEDVSMFANLQKAILEAREEKRKREAALTDGEREAEVEIDPAQMTRAERNERTAVLKAELDDRMTQYRMVLAQIENPGERPSPKEFFDNPEPYLALAQAGQAARVQRAQAEQQQQVGPNALPRAELSPDNPYNLPYLPEPQAEATPQVRQFNDFDVEAFVPQTPRVRIPQGVQPRLRASDFPKLEVLSLVPDKGIIAYHKGGEGVLLIGETIEGWELVAVYDTYAEFANGQRKHLVSMN